MKHLKRDKDDLSFAERLQLPTARLLQQAIQRNEQAINAIGGDEVEEEMVTDEVDEFYDADEEDGAAFFDGGGEMDGLPFADDGQLLGGDADDGSQHPGSSASSLGPSPSPSIAASDSSADEEGLDIQLSDGERQALDLNLFYGDFSDSEESIYEERNSLRSFSPTNISSGSQEVASSDSGSIDVGIQSKHGQVLLDALVEGYDPGPCPTEPPPSSSSSASISRLSRDERATLKHFRTWVRTGGTVRAYDDYAKNFNEGHESTSELGPKILSRKRAARIVKRVTGLEEMEWDMCPQSCMAFVGPHSGLDRCTTIDPKASGPPTPCGEPRYDHRGRPRKTFITLPLLPRVRVKFATGAPSSYLYQRAQDAISIDPEDRIFQDWGDGLGHEGLCADGFFSDSRHDAIMMSLDGAQMVDKKKSEGWLILLSSMNSPLAERFRRTETFIASIIPGPNNPIDIDSFLWPIIQELARAAIGYWVWDGVKKEWFLWRAWLVAACMDQKASSKVSQLTGTTGKSGCRMCLMKANYPSDAHKIGYFPLTTIAANAILRNRSRPERYEFPLPLRDDASYAEALEQIFAAVTTKQKLEVQKETGVCGLPLLAYSPAFSHPNFFPPDAFHLFGSNLPSLLWTTLTTGRPGDPFSFSDDQAQDFGRFVERSGKDLPYVFCSSTPRNPHEHAGPHYKMHEWTSMTYMFLLPYLFEFDAPIDVVTMVADLVSAVQMAMSDHGNTTDGFSRMHELFASFVRKWEQLYIRGDPSLLHRATISAHYLLHVSEAAQWLGSIRVASQARCEREIGLIKRSLRSYKAPFVNLANSAVQREHLRLIDLIVDGPNPSRPRRPEDYSLSTRITNEHKELTEWESNQEKQCLRIMEQHAFIPTPRPK
ncbi:hypothetical protein A4X13_0g8729, partial [Tilletia indica]